MAYDLEEQEKLEALKAWWERYGTLVTTAVVVAALAVAGWSGWRAYQGYHANQAMGYFEALEDAARGVNGPGGADAAARIKAACDTLRNEYAGTAYASRGVLIAAQALEEKKDYAGAQRELEWLVSRKDQSTLQPVARLRLAGLLLDQKQYDQALAQLNNPPAAFAALFADRRGDILAAQGKRGDARAAWQSALAAMPANDALKQIVQLKLDALSGA
ncbi:MAG: YfgM family protein [Bordetella sp.]|uniref:YfgM family protein n=1 Tax=Bordetella sp. TaxID=28081 RepID=UPI003F7CC6DC